MASSAFESAQVSIGSIWLVVCICLVMLLQVGFLLLEAGATRFRNSINVACKNKADIGISVIIFLLLGHTITFGPSAWGLFGTGLSPAADTTDNWNYILLYFGVCAATAASIVSGATCERMSFTAYLLTVVMIALLIFPVVAHWAYSNAIDPENQGFLAAIGFVDFAGSSVVHGVGAWVALAGIIAIGPRLGRFNPDTGRPQYLDGSSAVTSMAGTFLLMIGWLGFNGGASLAFDQNVPRVLINTIIGGAWGGVLSILICSILGWKLHPVRLMEGAISGLVAVTAAPHLMSHWMAFVVVFVAAIAALITRHIVLRSGLDDVVSVVATHGAAGVVGTLSVAFSAPVDLLPAGSVLGQLQAQAFGILLIFIWSFGIATVWFRLLGLAVPLRVDRLSEERGLDQSEHSVGRAADRFARELELLLETDNAHTERISLPEGDENVRLAALFNRMLDNLEESRSKEKQERARNEARERENRLAAEMAQRKAQEDLEASEAQAADIAKTVGAVSEGDLNIRVRIDGKTEAYATIGNGINALVKVLSLNIGRIAASAGEVTDRCDTLNRVSNDLNDRSASQIDAVQAITFKLESMAESASQNAELANDSLSIARDSQEATEDISRSLKHIETSMDDIIESTSKIEPIVALIEEIAFHTTLLALNASVEAARAGTHGRGFAVVATEVKDLANRVHVSASDIRTIVDAASTTVNTGAQAVGDAMGRATRIGEISTAVSNKITEIHTSSTGLRTRLTDLGDVVNEITEAAGSNAALAGETADGAKVLATLGEDLLESVASFFGYEEDVKQIANEEEREAEQIEGDPGDKTAGAVFF